jgi:hypothetical protein
MFRKKKRGYLKGKINELETNNKNKNNRNLYRGTNEFKKGYKPRINIIKGENGNLIADLHGVLNNYLLTYLLTYSLTHSLHGAGYYLKS